MMLYRTFPGVLFRKGQTMRKKREVLNFNLVENQDRCVYREYHHQTKPYHCGNMIIQYFIHVRNYGWTRYKGVIYNLNKIEQAETFLEVLKKEGFLVQEGRDYTIVDPNYIGYVRIPRYYLLFELYSNKGTALSRRECERIDKRVLE